MGGGGTGSQRQAAAGSIDFWKRLRPNAKFMDSNSFLPWNTIVQMLKFVHYGEGHEPPKVHNLTPINPISGRLLATPISGRGVV